MKAVLLRFLLGLATGLGLGAADSGVPRLPSHPPDRPFTFAVLGDNRGDDSGEQPPAFFQVLKAVNQQAPAFVLDTGDMIYGHTTDENQARHQWEIYRNALKELRAPIFHVPGNHDLWDEASARLYRELWGSPYSSFDFGNTRLIGLDTETGNGRLDQHQFQWLERQLVSCEQRNVFVFLHRPLFPVDGGIGSSLDEYPTERDRIHRLFVQHRRKIRAVFAGHEHLFAFHERDAITYYITGGGGAPIYTAPELGGFHHFLIVHVSGTNCDVEVKKITPPTQELQTARRVFSGEVLESWNQGLSWFAWDRSANIELTTNPAIEGSRSLRLNFDPLEYPWPVLGLSLASPWDLRQTASLSLKVYIPDVMTQETMLTPALQGASKHEAPAVKLQSGWNTVTADLDDRWIPKSERTNVWGVEWSLSTKNLYSANHVVFDDFRIQYRTGDKAADELLEGWERPLLWRVFDETVRAETIGPGVTGKSHGWCVHLDFATCRRPTVLARLNPPWDLSKVNALLLQSQLEGLDDGRLTIRLVLRANDIEYTSAPVQLHDGTHHLSFRLDPHWLPARVRAAIELVAFRFESAAPTAKCSITFQQLRAAGPL